MGDGGVFQSVRAHDWETRCEIRGQYAWERSSWQRTHVASHSGE